MTLHAGIDFGTSGARIAVIDAAANQLAEANYAFGETDDWVSTWRDALLALITAIPAAERQQIGAIAINGTSSTVLLCDRTGTPLTAPLLYDDATGASELERLHQFFAQPHFANAPSKAIVLSATSSLVKLLWWQRQPIYTQAHYFLHQADWLAFLLHGQLGISDYHNSLKLGYDVHQCRYPDWMAELGILPLLPNVVAPGTAIAPVKLALADHLGLQPNCQVHAGTTDSIAAFLASGATTPGEAVTSLGSTLVLKLLSQTPVEDGPSGIYSHRLGNLWLVGGASNTGGAVLRQFFTPTELTTLSAQIPVDIPSNLDYYPLTKPGDRFPINDPHLPPRLEPRPTDPIAFLHGLLESMARIEAKGYQLLQDYGATPLKQVYTAGGGAQNAAWTAIRTRCLGVPVRASAHTEAAYGTALLTRKNLSRF